MRPAADARPALAPADPRRRSRNLALSQAAVALDLESAARLYALPGGWSVFDPCVGRSYVVTLQPWSSLWCLHRNPTLLERDAMRRDHVQRTPQHHAWVAAEPVTLV